MTRWVSEDFALSISDKRRKKSKNTKRKF